ncbi:hydroxyisourate hydrolase [Neokomagataea anthophila]|uniref:5-hydroxyisourate hydrolase n=1 Tax=Neokomagataea anthophila TaxID=2826925 RepID=A0ABS5EAC9_9PROT|nr:hydroxyisourate hydrolase [Neokomagataea anthophila]MBR0560438.1 hydroxyisourate hydrolase [Neokomagataea anthophila]
MSSLSTHVLDTVSGLPAVGVTFRLYSAQDVLFEGVTNSDGRCPLLRDISLSAGTYRLEFEIGAYFRGTHTALEEPSFLDIVPIVFGLAEGRHVHVPLLAAPYGYSTYRGS